MSSKLKRMVEVLMGAALAMMVVAVLPALAEAKDVSSTKDDSSAPPTVQNPTSIIVGPGDSLWSISSERLGSNATPRRILTQVERTYALNRGRIGRDPSLLSVGQELLLPPEGAPAAVEQARRPNGALARVPDGTAPERDDASNRAGDGTGIVSQPASEPARKSALEQSPKPVLGSLPELAPAPTLKPALARVSVQPPVATTILSEVYDHGRKLLGLGILLLTLGLGCLIVWKLPMKRNGATTALPQVVPSELYRLFLETSPEGMLLATNEGTILEVNRQCCKLLRRTREEILALGVDVFDSSDSRLEVALRDLYKTGKFNGRMRVLRGGEHLSAVEASVSGWRIEGSEAIGITLRDLTDDQCLSGTPQLPEQKHVAISNGSFRITADGRIVSADSTMARLLGYESSEEMMASVSNIARKLCAEPGDWSELVRLTRELGTVAGFQTRMYRKDGGTVWISMNTCVVGDSDRNPTSPEGMVGDIIGCDQVDETLGSEERERTLIERSSESIYVVDPETKRVIESNTTLRAMLGYTDNELRDMKIYDLLAHEREDVDFELRHTLEERYRFVGERKHRRKDGALVEVEVVASAVRYGAKEMVVCAVVRDTAERKRTEKNLKSSLDTLLALREAGQALGSTLALEELGARFLRIVQRISGSGTTVISLPDDQRQPHVWRAVGLANLWRKARYTPEVQRALRVVAKTGEHMRCGLRSPETTHEHLEALFLPLRSRDRIIGVLEVYGPEAPADKGMVGILEALANQAASALYNAQLYEALAEREKRLKDLVGQQLAAQEEERRRVAYEVHDGLGQLVIGAYQHLQAFARFHAPKSEHEREMFEQGLGLVRRTIGETRRVIAGLRPTTLDDFGLQNAVRLEVEALREEGWSVGYKESLGEDEPLSAAVETALFRVAQEALTNVRKHADTRRACLSLGRLGHKIRLRVRDWGQGFDPAQTPNGGNTGESVGLSSMKERMALLGGEFKIVSRPGLGTLVAAELPLPRQGEAADESSVLDVESSASRLLFVGHDLEAARLGGRLGWRGRRDGATRDRG